MEAVQRKIGQKAWVGYFPFAFLALVALLSNVGLLSIGLWLHNSDCWIYPLASERFLQGQWSIFPFNQGYGGTSLTTFRAVFVGLYRLLRSNSDLATPHLIFSYLVNPILLSGLYLRVAQKFCSFRAAFTTALLVAVSFQAWVHFAGIDCFTAFFYFAGIMILLRGQAENPWLEFSQRRLLIAGALSGLMISDWRAGLLIVVAVMTPWSLVFELIRDFYSRAQSVWSSRSDFIALFGLRASLFFVGLFFLCEALDGDLGILAGHKIRLHSTPNLKLAVLSLGLVAFRFYGARLKVFGFSRFAVFGAGFILGILPEVFYYAQRKMLPLHWMSNGTLDLIRLVLYSPRANAELLLGWKSLTFDPTALKVFPIALAIAGAGALLFDLKHRKTLFLTMWWGMAVVAFGRVYMSGPAEPRYLIPMFPPLLLSIAVFWDRQERSRWGRGIATVLILGTLSFILQERRALIEWVRAEQKVEQVREVAQLFETQNVRLVLSDEYWQTHQYMWASQLRLVFAPPQILQWLVPETVSLIESEKRVGVLLTGKLEAEAGGVIRLHQHLYRLQALGQVGKQLKLFLGERVE